MITEPADNGAHPSPHRNRVGLAGLIYGLIAAPLAWIIGQIVSSTLAQEACYPKTQPLDAPGFGGVHGFHAALLLAVLLIGASGAFVAYRSWRATHREFDGDAHDLIQVGEGRSRFMALAGLLTSLSFMLGALFSVPAALLIPAC